MERLGGDDDGWIKHWRVVLCLLVVVSSHKALLMGVDRLLACLQAAFSTVSKEQTTETLRLNPEVKRPGWIYG